jgi:hypothetical protein
MVAFVFVFQMIDRAVRHRVECLPVYSFVDISVAKQPIVQTITLLERYGRGQLPYSL